LTLAPEAAPLSFDSAEEAIRAMRARGMRLSTPRRLVLEALFASEGPVSASQLAQTVSIDAASVYRNLELLARHGLVRHVHLGHGAGLWALVGRHELEYLCCERCGSFTAVSSAELDEVREEIRRRFGYRAQFTHFAIVGLCERCAAGGAPPAAARPGRSPLRGAPARSGRSPLRRAPARRGHGSG
jgi:Fur family ferric uptake transcriptional regulator